MCPNDVSSDFVLGTHFREALILQKVFYLCESIRFSHCWHSQLRLDEVFLRACNFAFAKSFGFSDNAVHFRFNWINSLPPPKSATGLLD